MTLRRIIQNVFSNFMLAAVSAALSLAVTPLVFRRLQPAGFGVLIFAASFSGVLECLDLGFYSALIRHVSEARAQNRESSSDVVVATAFYLLTGMGLVGVALVWLGLPILRHWIPLLQPGTETAYACLLVVLGLPCQLAAIALRSRLEGHHDFVTANAVDIAVAAARAIALVGVLMTGHGLLAAAGVYPAVALFRVAGLLAANVVRRPRFAPRWSSAALSSLHSIRKFASLAFLQDSLARIVAECDTVIAARFLTPVDLGFLGLGRKIGWLLQRSGQTTLFVAYPLVSQAASTDDRERLRAFLVAGARNVLALTVPAGIVVIGVTAELLQLWVGPQALPSTAIARVYVVIALAVVLKEVPITFLYATGDINPTLKTTTAALIVVGSGGWAAARSYGILGLALSFAIVQCATAVILTGYVLRRSRTPIWRWTLRALGPILLAGSFEVFTLIALQRLLPHGLAYLLLTIAGSLASFYAVFAFIPIGRQPDNWRQAVRRYLLESS